MSLLRPVIRACVTAALRDRTWAEQRVFDTDQRPLAAALVNVPKSPYIVIYTDADDMPQTVEGGLYDGLRRQLQIGIEIGVATAIERRTGEIDIKLSASDYGSEWAVDIVEAQVKAALYGDPQSDWGLLLRRLAPRVRMVRSRRGGQNQQGVRFNARKTLLVCNTLDDIAPGIVPAQNHPIRAFIDLCAMHPEENMQMAGQIMQQVLALTPSNAAAWRQAQALMGLDDDTVKALNITGTPIEEQGDNAVPAVLDTITLWDDDRDEEAASSDQPL